MWKYVLIAVIAFASCKTQTYVSDIDTSYHQVNKYVKSDQRIEDIISTYKGDLDAQMNVVIGRSDVLLEKAKPESSLGSWFCNILLDEARKIYSDDIDFAIQNYGGLRIGSIPAGNISVGKIYELMPFDNQLIVIEMNGEAVHEMALAMLKKGGWPISKNIQIHGSDDSVSEVYIADKLVHKDSLYQVALPDYVANGGDNMKFLRTYHHLTKDTMIRDVVINHLKKHIGQDRLITIDTSKRFFITP